MGAPLVALVRRALEAGDLYGPAWRALRRKDPLQAAAIEDPGEWTSAVAYAALLHEVTLLARGLDRLRALGYDFAMETLGVGGHFADLRRSWMETFGGTPTEIVRFVPHLWSVGTRANGEARIADEGRGFVRLVLEDAPVVRGSVAWQRMLEGSLEGLLVLTGAQVNVQLGPSALDPDRVEALVLWQTR